MAILSMNIFNKKTRLIAQTGLWSGIQQHPARLSA